MARYDDLDTKAIATATVVSSIVLIILILAGRALSYTWESYIESARTEKAKYHASDDAIAAQKAVLTASGKVQDPPLQEGGEPTTRIVLPLSKAQEIVGKELSFSPNT